MATYALNLAQHIFRQRATTRVIPFNPRVTVRQRQVPRTSDGALCVPGFVEMPEKILPLLYNNGC